jgi:hypothetical protein
MSDDTKRIQDAVDAVAAQPTGLKTAADYATSMSLDDYLDELEARGLSRPPWLP